MISAHEHKYSLLGEEENTYNRVSVTRRKGFQGYLFFSIIKWLFLLLVNLLALLFIWQNSRRTAGQSCGLPSDTLFGDIPWRPVVIENDERFIIAEPEPELMSSNQNESLEPSIWNELWPGTWVAFDDPSIGGAEGRGMQMTRVGSDPSAWAKTSEGFGVAVMHQLHCVMSVKQALMDYEAGRNTSRHAHGHLHHCLETLRQAVMCHGDLALEHPVDHDGRQGVTGWGNVHMCRDWEMIHQAILQKRITRSNQGGWVDYSVRLCVTIGVQSTID